MDDYDLGCRYFYGKRGRRPSYRKAFPLLLSAAKLGVRHAQNLVGVCYDDGLGVRCNPAAAAVWFAKAARQGHVVATFDLALCYDQGKGVAQNARRAATLYRRAAELGTRMPSATWP